MASGFFSSSSSSSSSILLLSALVLFSLLATTATSSTLGNGDDVGARTKIKNVGSNKEVQALGRFSVAAYNRQASSRVGPRHPSRGLLAFARVVQAESQVVGGVKYYLKVVAKVHHSGAEKVFDAVVVVKPWLKSKKLVSFAPSHV